MADNRTSIVLTAEDRASATLGKVGQSIGKLSDSAVGLSSLKTALGGLAGAFSAGALISFAKGTIDAADNINDLSQRVGISIRDLATWQLAAEQSGTSLESVARGVKGLAKNMVDNGAAFRAAGITATDANGAMVQLADIFKGMPDGIEKTTLAVTLFGKAGMDMIPLLNQGSAGLADTQAKAARYAEKLAELAPKADEFNDKLKELEISGKAASINALLPMIDGLVGLTAWFKDATSGVKGLGDALGYIGEKTNLEIFKLIADGAKVVDRMIAPGRNPKTGWQMRAEMDTAKPGALALPGANSAAEAEAVRRGMELNTALGGNKAKAKGAAAKDRTSEYERTARQIVEGEEQAAKDVAEAWKVWEKIQIEDHKEVADATELQWKQVFETIDREQEDAIASGREYLDALADDAKKASNFARDMGMTFASAFEDAIVGGKSFSDVLKGLATDIERIIIRKTVTEPLGNAIADAIGGSGGISGFLSVLFGGVRASGGPVDAGKFYVVGENGPELLMAGSNGTVIPNGAGGGGTSITINAPIDARGADASVVPQIRQALAELEARVYRNVPGVMGRASASRMIPSAF